MRLALAAALDACDLDAIAKQLKSPSRTIGETLQWYLAKDAPQEMELFFELFAVAKATDFYYQCGYAAGAGIIIPAADKPAFCAAVTKKANKLLARKPQ